MRVGTYVRTGDGRIGQLIEPGVFRFSDDVNDGVVVIEKDSDEVIDLVRVGDYVNGEKVRGTYIEGNKKYLDVGGVRLENDDIFNVVTLEEFMSNRFIIK